MILRPVGRGVLTAPPKANGVRVTDGGLRTARPTHHGLTSKLGQGLLQFLGLSCWSHWRAVWA